MDPNATLATLLKLSQEILSDDEGHTADVVELAEHVDAMNRWLSTGGFLPDRWARAN